MHLNWPIFQPRSVYAPLCSAASDCSFVPGQGCSAPEEHFSIISCPSSRDQRLIDHTEPCAIVCGSSVAGERMDTLANGQREGVNTGVQSWFLLVCFPFWRHHPKSCSRNCISFQETFADIVFQFLGIVKLTYTGCCFFTSLFNCFYFTVSYCISLQFIERDKPVGYIQTCF